MQNVGVTITAAPHDWQIIQRNRENYGTFIVAGYWQTTESYFRIQIRLVNENDGSPVTAELDWHNANIDSTTRSFSIELSEIPAGGLYRLETRIIRPKANDTRPLRGDYRHHLGVGDVYVITGQSNASGTGQGQAYDPPQLGVHLFGNDECWKLATHPLEDATGTLHPITITSIFHGHSPWLSFAGKLQRECNIPIGLIPAALGGSSICQWVRGKQSPAALFDNMLDMVHKATSGKVAGILWYQGESDCMDAGKLSRYAERFEQLLELFERNFPGVDIFTAQLNRYINSDTEIAGMWSKMRELQRQFAQRYCHVHLIVCAGLPLSDVIHNSAAANIAIGERFATAALQHIYGRKIIAAFPEPEQIAFTANTYKQIKITFTNLSGNWVANNFIADFAVEDETGWIELVKVVINQDNSIELTLSRSAVGRTIVHAFYGNHSAVTLCDDGGRSLTPFSVECMIIL